MMVDQPWRLHGQSLISLVVRDWHWSLLDLSQCQKRMLEITLECDTSIWTNGTFEVFDSLSSGTSNGICFNWMAFLFSWNITNSTSRATAHLAWQECMSLEVCCSCHDGSFSAQIHGRQVWLTSHGLHSQAPLEPDQQCTWSSGHFKKVPCILKSQTALYALSLMNTMCQTVQAYWPGGVQRIHELGGVSGVASAAELLGLCSDGLQKGV